MIKKGSSKFVHLLPLLGLVITIVVLGVTVYVAKQQADNRSRASGGGFQCKAADFPDKNPSCTCIHNGGCPEKVACNCDAVDDSYKGCYLKHKDSKSCLSDPECDWYGKYCDAKDLSTVSCYLNKNQTKCESTRYCEWRRNPDECVFKDPNQGGGTVRFNGVILASDTGSKRWTKSDSKCSLPKGIGLSASGGAAINSWPCDGTNGGHFDATGTRNGKVSLTLTPAAKYSCGTWKVTAGKTAKEAGTGCTATFNAGDSDWSRGIVWTMQRSNPPR